MSDVLLDVNIVVDICTPREEFALASAAAIARCLQTGNRVWLYAGSVQTYEYVLQKAIADQYAQQNIELSRKRCAQLARQALQSFAEDKQWLAALAGEGDVFRTAVRALSTIGCTSFFPSKPLGGYGDGGACFTDDEELAVAMRRISIHGQERRYYHTRIGINGRLDTLQAAVLLAKFDVFPAEIEVRQWTGTSGTIAYCCQYVPSNLYVD